MDHYIVSEESGKVTWLEVFECDGDDDCLPDVTVCLMRGTRRNGKLCGTGGRVSPKWNGRNVKPAAAFLAALVRGIKAGNPCPTTPQEGIALAAAFK